MTRIADTERRVRNVVRLRRAERTSPAADDIAAVRTDLEREIGPTVSRALAARLLGVSQTALDRWVLAGDVPCVITPAGREAIPRESLVELIDHVERRRAEGERHPLAAVLRERRDRAQELPKIRLPHRHEDDHGHRRAELRSLAYHRAVARRLDDEVIADARHRMRTWQQDGKLHPDYARRWQEILAKPPARIARLISEDTERARTLRQCSPFAGTLSEPERRAILSTID